MTIQTAQDEVINREPVIHTPYRGAYKADLDKPDEATPPAPVEAQDQEPISQEEKTFKKRYGDLRTHLNRVQDEARRTVDALQAKVDALSRKKLELPKTEAEITAFANEYPDVFKMLVSVARKESHQTKAELEREFETVREAKAELSQERAVIVLTKLHPDWAELRENPEFHEWADQQLPQIKSWLYDNPDNPELCAKAIDLYKMEKGFNKRKNKKDEDRNDGARAVARSRSPEVQENSPQKMIWKESEIAKMSRTQPNWFEENEAEIDKASREGRIEFDLSPKRK